MRRQLPPSKLLVPSGPQAFPRHFLGESTVIVNHYSGFEKAIPAIPSLPGFKTSAGRSIFFLEWSCDQGYWDSWSKSHFEEDIWDYFEMGTAR